MVDQFSGCYGNSTTELKLVVALAMLGRCVVTTVTCCFRKPTTTPAEIKMSLNENASLLIDAKGIIRNNQVSMTTAGHATPMPTLWQPCEKETNWKTPTSYQDRKIKTRTLAGKWQININKVRHRQLRRFGTRESWNKGKDGLKCSEATTTTPARLNRLWQEEPRAGLNSTCCRGAVVITWDERWGSVPGRRVEAVVRLPDRPLKPPLQPLLLYG